jgi:hypothetical protein
MPESPGLTLQAPKRISLASYLMRTEPDSSVEMDFYAGRQFYFHSERGWQPSDLFSWEPPPLRCEPFIF